MTTRSLIGPNSLDGEEQLPLASESSCQVFLSKSVAKGQHVLSPRRG